MQTAGIDNLRKTTIFYQKNFRLTVNTAITTYHVLCIIPYTSKLFCNVYVHAFCLSELIYNQISSQNFACHIWSSIDTIKFRLKSLKKLTWDCIAMTIKWLYRLRNVQLCVFTLCLIYNTSIHIYIMNFDITLGVLVENKWKINVPINYHYL